MEEQIQDNLELVRVDEEAYLNELIVYLLKFKGQRYDWLSGKLVEVLVKVP